MPLLELARVGMAYGMTAPRHGRFRSMCQRMLRVLPNDNQLLLDDAVEEFAGMVYLGTAEDRVRNLYTEPAVGLNRLQQKWCDILGNLPKHIIKS